MLPIFPIARPKAGQMPPAGGARASGGRGAFALAVAAMTLTAVGLSAPSVRAAETFPIPALPSGLTVEVLEKFLEVKADGTNNFARFRFLAPKLSDVAEMEYEMRLKDMDVLCRDYAIPHVKVTKSQIDRVVISLSDKPIEFGATDPSVMQFFESYRIENGACIWEEF